MHELLVSLEYDVSRSLAPIQPDCDTWWWHLGDKTPVFQDDEIATTYDEFVSVTPTTRVGHPGWCSRFIDFMPSQLSVFIAVSSEQYPASSIHEIDQIHGGDLMYMSPKELDHALPANAALVCRLFHMAYSSLVFRSHKHAHLVERNVPQLDSTWAPHRMRSN